MISESAAMCEGGDACVKKTAGLREGMCMPVSAACVWASIARVPSPKGSLCFFLWHQRKKRVDRFTRNKTVLFCILTFKSFSINCSVRRYRPIYLLYKSAAADE